MTDKAKDKAIDIIKIAKWDLEEEEWETFNKVLDVFERETAREIFEDIEELGHNPDHLCTKHNEWCDCYDVLKRKWLKQNV